MGGTHARRPHQIASKGHSTPRWATVDALIGYTFNQALTARQVETKLQEALDSFKKTKANPKNPWNDEVDPNLKPSVYYKQGHATLQHRHLSNLGWTKSAGWVWTFFGTVPHAKAKIIHEKTDPRPQSRAQGSAGSSAGKSYTWRADYGDELMSDYGSFCWSSDALRTRTEWSHGKPTGKGWQAIFHRLKAPDPDPTLLEIWGQNDGTFHGHYSRNSFVWVSDKDLRDRLHKFATQWIATLDGAGKLI